MAWDRAAQGRGLALAPEASASAPFEVKLASKPMNESGDSYEFRSDSPS